MKLSLHGPVDLLKRFDWGTERYVLAHACLESPEYLQYMSDFDSRGRTMILDNGADELGVGMSGEVLRYLIGKLSPDVAILPDVLKKARQTITLSEAFLAESEWLPVQPEWMAVAQGRTRSEFLDCLEYWWEHPDVSIIGIPYDIDFDPNPVPGSQELKFEYKKDRRAYGRLAILRGIAERVKADGRETAKSLHLLGANCPSELYQLRTDPVLAEARELIRSHDTTMPFAVALNGRKFIYDGEVPKLSGDKDWPAVDLHAEYDESIPYEDYLTFYFDAVLGKSE